MPLVVGRRCKLPARRPHRFCSAVQKGGADRADINFASFPRACSRLAQSWALPQASITTVEGATSGEEFENPCTLEFEPFDLAALRIQRVKLKYLLGNVHPDDREFHFGFFEERLMSVLTFAHSGERASGRSTFPLTPPSSRWPVSGGGVLIICKTRFRIANLLLPARRQLKHKH